MRTNIEIDDDLLAEAMQAAGTITAQATVEAGLLALIRRDRMRKETERRDEQHWVEIEAAYERLQRDDPAGWTEYLNELPP